MFNKLKNFLYNFKSMVGNHHSLHSTTYLHAYQLKLLQKNLETKNLFLHEVGFKVYSQWEEDGIIDFLVASLKIEKPRILELGAGNFLESNSRYICEYLSAAAYVVDAREDLPKGVSSSGLEWKTHIFSEVTWISPSNISEICLRARAKLGRIDILSIDLDGQDYWVLKEIELSKIQIVICEFNPIFGNKIKVSVPENHSFVRSKNTKNLFWGGSLNLFSSHMSSQGFSLVGTNLVANNAFFVRSELKNRIRIKDYESINSLEQLDYLIRESIDLNGSLDFFSYLDSLNVIKDQLVFDAEDDSIVPLGPLLGL